MSSGRRDSWVGIWRSRFGNPGFHTCEEAGAVLTQVWCRGWGLPPPAEFLSLALVWHHVGWKGAQLCGTGWRSTLSETSLTAGKLT